MQPLSHWHYGAITPIVTMVKVSESRNMVHDCMASCLFSLKIKSMFKKYLKEVDHMYTQSIFLENLFLLGF